MNPGDKIKKRRIELGMSQEELAKKMGYKSRSSINKIENGREVSDKIVNKLAKALDVNPIYLSDWENTVVDEDKDIVDYVFSHPNEFSDGIEDMTDEELALKYILRTHGHDLLKVGGEYSFHGKNSGINPIKQSEINNMINVLSKSIKELASKIDENNKFEETIIKSNTTK